MMSPLTKYKLHRQRSRSRRLRRGAVMAEAAIVLPIFILAMVGIIEFGRAIMVQQIVVNAAREGARRAIVPGATSDEVKDLVGDYLDNAGLAAPGRQIEVLDEDDNVLDLSTANSHDLLQVVVAVPYNEVGVGISGWFRDRTLGHVVQMRKE